MKITLQQVQANIGSIANRHEYTTDIVYELMAAYGRSKSAITQLREGTLNKAEDPGAVLQKDVVYFNSFAKGTPLEDKLLELYEDPLTQRYKPRYLIVTDLEYVAAKDNLKNTTPKIFKLADIDDHLDFFYGWTGDEVVDNKTEAVADRRAADKMNELYVEIEKQNREEFITNPQFRHELNVFFTRLLFCFFAEDTGIYEDKQFSQAIKTYTQTDGSDLSWFFGELFSALDTEHKGALKSPFKDFPYVNGSIFDTSKHAIAIPKFSAQARHLILEVGRQNWGEINPDIFGTIFQGVVDPGHRDENGMDYTSVPNIMKVIQPLFLDDLHEQYDKHYDNEKKLWALLNRIHAIKIFDPACGSGNFLIIAYKELRDLQHKIIARIDQLRPAGLMGGLPDNWLININNFYGIEIDDFAHELAVLSLFLAKHQMNQEFTQQFGKALSIIPLIDIPTIVRGNAAHLDWQTVLPNVGHTPTKVEQSAMFDFGEPEQAELPISEKVYDEIYLIGNPPYKGYAKQTSEQKSDMSIVFNQRHDYKKLDYIACWFIKAARYIEDTKAKTAFVSTNSINQGEQVGLLWPDIFAKKIDISFCHTSFKWRNSARENAGVTVVVIGLVYGEYKDKKMYTNGIEQKVENINAYLVGSSSNTIIQATTRSIAGLPEMIKGSSPGDGGNLLLSDDERLSLIEKYSDVEKYIKKYIGADEFLSGKSRYCLIVSKDDQESAYSVEDLKQRFDAVRELRLKSTKAATVKKALTPYAFDEIKYKNEDAILFPQTTSENRPYIPIGYIGSDYIPSNAVRVVYGGELWLLGVLTSRMHNVWLQAVAGRLETRIQYSNTLCYNTYPIQQLTEDEKNILNTSARRVLLARASHPEKTLANMYDPDKMPADLREAHDENDRLVDSLYKKGGFINDEDRLAALFALYEQMTAKEKTK